jgi:hypothetical protein
MNNINEVSQPEVYEPCRDREHWSNMILAGECYTCHAVLQARTGVQIDERPRVPMTEMEVDALYEVEAQTPSEAYRGAH